jgi:hypothetical protein
MFLSSAIERSTEQHPPKQLGFTIPFMTEDVVWLAPIRTKPRRTYDEYKLEFSSEGAHTPYL